MNEIMDPRRRIDSIDWMRGLSLLLMLLGHALHFFLRVSPEDIEKTTLLIFLTRFITHVAPTTFVLLAGMSVWLVKNRRGLAQTSRRIFIRGLWLILLELTVVRIAWGHTSFRAVVFQVIFVIGISMMLLSAVMHLKKIYILLVSLVMIAGHNALDALDFSGSSAWMRNLWMVLHQGGIIEYLPGWTIHVWWPLIPWPAVMFLGYLLGSLYDYEPQVRRRSLIGIGLVSLILFLALRLLDVYGDPNSWHLESSFVTTSMLFMLLEKYPPSLQYLSLTFSASLLLLALLDKADLRRSWIAFFGQNSLFIYVVHLYILAIAARLFSGIVGHEFSNALLFRVYLIATALTLLMYWLCKLYRSQSSRIRAVWSQAVSQLLR